ncbi:hypothetical protein F8G81_09525 [Arthrobacter sp. CDRTa11]|uniref:hypothetical protein n=1 Tax=Arthrobacter sp. CDRTa11 TaxID=2651199 RepID=UPI002265A5C4|nr:hypothetical protein [Arthrobacter sp. CDRTa11]UZX02824.1 hypothetical protein F8G81_09525 [Arthrobacter sp. CDRTa11]
MSSNPVLKPRLATPALILTSAAVSIAAGYFLTALSAGMPRGAILIVGGVTILSASVALAAIWLTRFHRRRAWMAAAEQKWHEFDDAKRSHRTTTEITVISVDALEPTGSWITIYWNRFDHVQQAWIEALPEPIWPGSVLLISPDPAQVKPGLPWPQTYYIGGPDTLAWAPKAEPTRKPRKIPARAHS